MAICCIYHKDDLDGLMSKFIVEKNLPECKSIGYNYSDIFPIDEIEYGDTVFLVDLSPTIEDMKVLTNKSQVIWIDHHISSLEKYEELKDNYKFFQTILNISNSACYLTYRYFNPEKAVPSKPVPLGIKLLSYADTGNWNSDRKTKPFDYGVRSLAEIDNKIFNDIYMGIVDIKEVVKRGNIVLSYLNYYSKISLEPLSSIIEFEGHKALLLNVNGISTYIMDFWDPKECPLFIRYFRKDKKWTVMFASEGDLDVSIIAKKFGGGGHKNASGIICNILPFPI